MFVSWRVKSTKALPNPPWFFSLPSHHHTPTSSLNFLTYTTPISKALSLVALLVIMSTYSSGWYPTTSSSSPSINFFIPYTSSSSRETHEMYNELGFILRPSRTTPSPTTTTKPKYSFMSYVNEVVRHILGQTQLSGPSEHQVAFPIDKRVAIA